MKNKFIEIFQIMKIESLYKKNFIIYNLNNKN